MRKVREQFQEFIKIAANAKRLKIAGKWHHVITVDSMTGVLLRRRNTFYRVSEDVFFSRWSVRDGTVYTRQYISPFDGRSNESRFVPVEVEC